MVTRKRKRARLTAAGAEADEIDRLFADRPAVQLEPAHYEFLEKYRTTGFNGYWHPDLGCFVAHTCGIAKAFEQLQ